MSTPDVIIPATIPSKRQRKKIQQEKTPNPIIDPASTTPTVAAASAARLSETKQAVEARSRAVDTFMHQLKEVLGRR